jgi:NAD(P)-dependent dehydrogenase (short-subunit alcohol dehydrogenase family)
LNAEFPQGTVLITGGVSGIGLATAQALLEDGVGRCALIDLNPPEPGLVEGLQSKYGAGRVLALQCDVAVRDDVASTIAAVAAESPIAGLVNCAGVLLAKPSLDLTLDDLHRLFDIHVAGSLFTAQAAARYWIDAGTGGSIVNVSSIAAGFGWPGRLPYPVVKAGIEATTRTLAVEWARWNIRVNAVAPGSVDSPMMADGRRPPGIRPLSEVADRHALGRVAAASEIGAVISFLLSSKSSFMTGAVVPVDGGFTITKDSAKELAE